MTKSNTGTLIRTRPIPRNQALIARKTLTIGGTRFPRGSKLPSQDIKSGPLQALIDTRAAMWEPVQHGRQYALPVDLPEVDPPKAPPKVQLVYDLDPETAWHLTKAAMVRCCDGNAALAHDLLMADVSAWDLYRRAITAATAREAKRRKVVSVCPTDIGL